ncbi:MAG: N-acetyl-D-glucosamine ABC transporter, permease protein 2 [uncultured Thermomicrobiales bacterium]|uniref:N-acetyl-D-glucosamine ABC transporter, permease protein 2 n=1 Tax=uncultured Thermomicrobiales bacterium TaxID=1645740 RepID=A0A6J4V721_9BACT|nr:MAG: N-acetyl-D-glucosamine ABC transporter, permease protein 2 [uncultured Thermomicrobiales bacterium]
MATNVLTRSGPLARGARSRPRGQRLSVRWAIISVVMWALALIFLLPFVWMVVSSLKREIDVFRLPVRWWPDPLTWQNYVKVWTGEHPLTRYIGNSLLVAVARVLGELLTASLAAYAFARLRFRGRNAVFLLYISTLIIPHQMLLVPRFILYRQLGIYDTLWALILPGIFTVFGTFLLRQFFMTIPQELSDAARVDGANEFQIYWRIVLPLARPALASLAILAFVWSWNDYETPLVMLTTESRFTIPLGLTSYIDESGGFSAALIMAGAVSSIIPIFVVFLIMQRQFIQALARSGLKG